MNSYPLNNAAYDVIAVLFNKSKAIEAYQNYMDDFRDDTQLNQLFVSIKHDEIRHVEQLKAHLGRLLVQKESE